MNPPADVLAAYGFEPSEVSPLAGGLINETFIVGAADSPRAVLQRLHPVFDPSVNLDIEALTERLASAGLLTPLLIRTRHGDPFVGRWRAITYVPGVAPAALTTDRQAESAGALVGRFHAALDGWPHSFAFARAGVHDTALHLARLRERASGDEPLEGTSLLGRAILSAAASLPPLPAAPLRICHGDLKVSNILFDGEDAVCLIDLDTIGYQMIAYELGDAMRSWCNQAAGEDGTPRFAASTYVAALRGYLTTMPASVEQREVDSLPIATTTVCIELAARFAADIYDDAYFGWDATRYQSRRAHNRARAEAMLGLGASVRAHFGV